MDDDSIKKLGFEINSRPIDDFDGLSPEQMHIMLNNPFSTDSVVQFNDKLTTSQAVQVPFCNLVISLLLKIKNGNNKLTAKGYLSPAIVKELYERKYISEYLIDSGLYKLSREEDSLTIHLAHLLCKVSGYIRKMKGTLRITKKGFELLDNPSLLVKDMFYNHVFKFNLGYFDGFPETNAGAFDISYTLFLLDKYGDKGLPTSFYSDKLLTAFPDYHKDFKNDIINSINRDFEHFIDVRIFNRFLYLYGFISGYSAVDDDKTENNKIKKTNILNQVFTINYKP